MPYTYMYAVNCSILHSMHEAIYIICPTLYFCHGKKLYFPLHSMHPIHWKFSLVFPTPPISHLSEISSRLPTQFGKSPTIWTNCHQVKDHIGVKPPTRAPESSKMPNQGTRMELCCKFWTTTKTELVWVVVECQTHSLHHGQATGKAVFWKSEPPWVSSSQCKIVNNKNPPKTSLESQPSGNSHQIKSTSQRSG